MKVRLLIIVGAIILFSNIALAQYDNSGIVIDATNKAAADINSTTSATTENLTNQADLFLNRKNEMNMFSSSVSMGTSVIASKYVSVYNIPIGFSFKSKMFFRNNADAYENLSFRLIIPYIQKKFEAPVGMGLDTLEYKTSGFSDVTVKANYNLILKKMFFSFGVYAKLPTAKKKNMVKERDIPLGTGSTDVNISVFFARNMSDKINLHSSFGYELRPTYEKDNVKYNYGDKINFLVGFDYLVKIVRVGADFAYATSENSEAPSTFGPKVEIPGITTIDALPYLKVAVSEKMDAKFFGVVPIYSKWKNFDNLFATSIPDPDRKVRIGFMFTYRFDKAPNE